MIALWARDAQAATPNIRGIRPVGAFPATAAMIDWRAPAPRNLAKPTANPPFPAPDQSQSAIRPSPGEFPEPNVSSVRHIIVDRCRNETVARPVAERSLIPTPEESIMKLFSRIALVGATGLVALSLPAHAIGTTPTADTPRLESTSTTKPIQLAQRPYDPSAGSVGFKKSKKKKAKK
jgi:hypothetical protein